MDQTNKLSMGVKATLSIISNIKYQLYSWYHKISPPKTLRADILAAYSNFTVTYRFFSVHSPVLIPGAMYCFPPLFLK